MPYEIAESIILAKDYVGGPDMRGRQSMSPLRSDGLYNTLLLSTVVIATLGTVASSVSSAFNIKSINGFGKYGDYYGMKFQTGAGKTRVLSFHNHGHKVAKGIKNIGEWHWQLQKWNPMSNRTSGTIASWIWWSLTRM